jgi:hypothetical protein
MISYDDSEKVEGSFLAIPSRVSRQMLRDPPVIIKTMTLLSVLQRAELQDVLPVDMVLNRWE